MRKVSPVWKKIKDILRALIILYSINCKNFKKIAKGFVKNSSTFKILKNSKWNFESKIVFRVSQILKINRFILKWIEDYLSGVERNLSTPSQVTSGVPQSSVLVSLLFPIFIEDLIKRLLAVTDVSLLVYDIKLLSYNPLKLPTAPQDVEN